MTCDTYVIDVEPVDQLKGTPQLGGTALLGVNAPLGRPAIDA